MKQFFCLCHPGLRSHAIRLLTALQQHSRPSAAAKGISLRVRLSSCVLEAPSFMVPIFELIAIEYYLRNTPSPMSRRIEPANLSASSNANSYLHWKRIFSRIDMPSVSLICRVYPQHTVLLHGASIQVDAPGLRVSLASAGTPVNPGPCWSEGSLNLGKFNSWSLREPSRNTCISPCFNTRTDGHLA